MNIRRAAILLAFAAVGLPLAAADAPPSRPMAGPVEIMHLKDVKPGMKGIAWTVFQGTEPEAVPIEIVGRLKNQNGPNQDIIVAKMLGKAKVTNVAGGMSGSPVYIDGKLVGAVALRMSTFSPDAICGITPIELMLEINDLDKTRPDDARTPEKAGSRNRAVSIPDGLLAFPVSAGPMAQAMMVPIEAPLMLSGFSDSALREFGGMFTQLGVNAVQGGAANDIHSNKPAPGWEHSLNPGDSIAGVLVDGDMSVTGLGTVTYNDGKRVLGFGHSFFNLGPVDIPMSKGEVIMTLASSYQPNKMANATEIVGALHQDRFTGIMGVLGAESDMIPVTVKLRSLDDKEKLTHEKDFHFNVFVHQKWTPYLMMLTLYNSLSELNELADETTYRLSGKVELNGAGPAGIPLSTISLSTMAASGEAPMPAPLAMAAWWGNMFNRLYLNNVNTPDVKRVNVTVDLLPERRVATIESAWVQEPEVRAGDSVPVKVFLRPYRGERIERDFMVKIPEGLAKGDHRIMLSDADTVNRMQNMAGMMDRYIDLPQTVSLLNQERSNNKLYVSLVESTPTAYFDDKTLPSLPASVLNVMQAGRASNRAVVTSPETATEQMALPFDSVVTGSYSLRIHVK